MAIISRIPPSSPPPHRPTPRATESLGYTWSRRAPTACASALTSKGRGSARMSRAPRAPGLLGIRSFACRGGFAGTAPRRLRLQRLAPVLDRGVNQLLECPVEHCDLLARHARQQGRFEFESDNAHSLEQALTARPEMQHDETPIDRMHDAQ